jgi:AraC-like DNA-binding protein
MLYLSGIVITFFLSIILIAKRGKTQSDKILAIWLSLTCLHFTFYYIFATGAYVQFPYWLGYELPLPLMYCPFLYLYASSLTAKTKFGWKSLLHFIPAAALYVRLIPFYISSVEERIYVYQHKGIGYESVIELNQIAIIISGVTYIILTLLMLHRHRKNIENEFSNTDKINLNWLRYLTYGTSAIWMVIILGLDDKWIYTTAAFYVFFLGVFGIRQVGIFSNQKLRIEKNKIDNGNNLEVTETIEDSNYESSSPEIVVAPEKVIVIGLPEKMKYRKSSLREEDGKRIHEELIDLMAKKELYKNPELTLAEVAGHLNVHPNIISQVINSFEKRSFYDYVNSQRVEEFKKLTLDSNHRQFTLLAIAFECGFNSKTAFNRNFKKVTNMSPSEFLNQQHVVLADS